MTGKHQTASLIADTAMELFRKKGYESVSVNSICEQAGVSRVTFYSIFSNKDQIIGFILNDFQNQFKEDFSSFIAAENDKREILRPVRNRLCHRIERRDTASARTCDNK